MTDTTVDTIIRSIVSLQENSNKTDQALLKLSEALTEYTLALSERVKNIEGELIILQSVVMRKEDK